MDTNMDKYLGTMLDDRYEILEVIGTGGMAVVYKAMCHRLNRYVAVKILRDELANDEEFRKRFQTEAQAVAMLSHPNIVSVYDVSHSDGVEYIVMELIEGVTLMQYMKKKGALGWKEALHFAVQISKALEHAHEKGIVHRDIKPQNIMILKDGTIKVADFGIAALESAQEKKSDQTVGSVHYIAPEQARGEQPDPRSDIYSLGVVMYEMLTGKMPYDGDTAEQVAMKHITGHPVPPQELNPDIPEELAAITLKAMNSDINARYQSASELLRDLEDFRKQQAAANLGSGSDEDVEILDVITPDVHPIGKAGELSKEKYARRRRRSRKVSILSGACGVLVFLIAVFVFLWNYWLRDIFSVAERINIPNFVGASYEDIVNSSEFKKLFNFEVNYAIDPDVPEGQIISQDPEADRSMMVVPEGIDVSLTVSTGVRQTVIPDVTNKHYQEATIELQNAGFIVEIASTEASDTVTVDYVISTDPAPGEELAAGSTVFLTVSAGPSIKLVTMPNLVGSTEKDAIARIESSNLSYGDTTYIHSDYDEGTVIRQSIDAYSEVEEHTRIFIWVSLGPETTPTPEPTPSPTPPTESAGPGYYFAD
ncbi:MAG: Stk1 family PASTA domain-containing Ser/Thr kinase [Oscillospiraceae bacterium]|nr:Stk1 family PASTA domain-containing Ser/Thr kinase [Oscillospiraceae bacterium]